MNKTSCQNVNMVCFFFWLINEIYEKIMRHAGYGQPVNWVN